MLRSLASVLFSVFVGLTFAKFIEGGLSAVFSIPSATAFPPERPMISQSLAMVLAFSWSLAAFASAMLALLLARRWAPLAWLSAATIFFNSLIVMVGAIAPWFLWLFAIGGSVLGAYAAIYCLSAQYEMPSDKPKRDFNF